MFMEIISYVGGSDSYRRRGFDFGRIFDSTHLPRIRVNRRRFYKPAAQKNFSFAFSNFYPELILKKLGRYLWSLPVIALLSAIPYGIYKLSGVLEYRTNPLVLENNAETELELLDKAMLNFALTAEVDYDDDGFIGTLNKSDFKEPVKYTNYKVKSGDTISGITKKFGLSNISTIIAVNNIENVRSLNAGKTLVIPSVDGLKYTVVKGDTLDSICAKYKVTLEDLLDVNDLSSRSLSAGQELFVPGATLDKNTLKKAMGERFASPIAIKYRMTSGFGYRGDPFTGVRQFHNGIDMACPQGTPVLSTMAGKVVAVAWSNVYGNYIIVDHGNGYQTMYGHLSKTLVKKGQEVSQKSRLGLVGSTGYSTGPHLHFTVFKNSKPINPLTVLK